MLECTVLDYRDFISTYMNNGYNNLPLGKAFCIAFKVEDGDFKNSLLLEDSVENTIRLIEKSIMIN